MRKRDKFREMLDEITSLELTSQWKEVKKMIREDPRYLKYNSSERVSVTRNFQINGIPAQKNWRGSLENPWMIS